MKKSFLFYACLLGMIFVPHTVFSQCNSSNYTSAVVVDANSYPYTTGNGITVTPTLLNITTLSNTTYSCGGNSYATTTPAWWLQNNTGLITLNFSTAVTTFTVVVNGTNSGEVFTFNAATGSVTLSDFCSASFNSVGNVLNCTGAGTQGTIITINNPIGSTQYSISHNGVSAGSRVAFMDCTPITPLNAQLGGFSGKMLENEKSIQLDWFTVMEKNNDLFSVERSANGVDFEEITSIKSKGDAQAKQTYQTMDAAPLWGSNFYRLNMIDVDGNHQFSQTIEVAFTTSSLAVYPNPTSGTFIIEGKNIENGKLRISDAMGRYIQELPIVDNQEIDFSHLPNGVYFLKIISNYPTKFIQIIKK